MQDASVFSVLSDSTKAAEQLNRQLDIDKLEDIKDKIDEQRQEMEEKQEFFINAGQVEDTDDLMDELRLMRPLVSSRNSTLAQSQSLPSPARWYLRSHRLRSPRKTSSRNSRG